MVKIRLRRVGAKKRPMYRIVAADARAPRDGAFLEVLGLYNPLTDPAIVVVDEEKALKWLRSGAQPTETTARLLARTQVLERLAGERQGRPGAPALAETQPESEEEVRAELVPQAESAVSAPAELAAPPQPGVEEAVPAALEVTESPVEVPAEAAPTARRAPRARRTKTQEGAPEPEAPQEAPPRPRRAPRTRRTRAAEEPQA